MKDFALELASKQSGSQARLNVIREYLQAYLLRILQDHGFFRTTAFVGGTALRFLHGLPRYSEDMDFSATAKGGKKITHWLDILRPELAMASYTVNTTYGDGNAVQYAFVKFERLLFEAGISPLPAQKLSVKLEIDTRPPAGAHLTTEIVNKYFPMAFQVYDVPSLFSGKLHALLTRKYTKGRDFFDLGWYLSRWRDLLPNMTQLRNALKQTGWKGAMPTESSWRELLSHRIRETDWKKVERDVGPFLERPQDKSVFSRENLLRLLEVPA